MTPGSHVGLPPWVAPHAVHWRAESLNRDDEWPKRLAVRGVGMLSWTFFGGGPICSRVDQLLMLRMVIPPGKLPGMGVGFYRSSRRASV